MKDFIKGFKREQSGFLKTMFLIAVPTMIFCWVMFLASLYYMHGAGIIIFLLLGYMFTKGVSEDIGYYKRMGRRENL